MNCQSRMRKHIKQNRLNVNYGDLRGIIGVIQKLTNDKITPIMQNIYMLG